MVLPKAFEKATNNFNRKQLHQRKVNKMKFENFYDHIKVSGDEGLAATIAAVAVVQVGPVGPDGQVTLQTTADHGFLAGSHVYIENTTNYNGLRRVVSVPSSTTINIQAKFIAETPAGTETIKVVIAPKAEFRFVGFTLHIGTAPTTSENFTITLDAIDGSAYDTLIYTKDFSVNSDTDIIWVLPEDSRVPYHRDDLIRIAWDNTDDRTYGMKLFWQRRL